MFLCLVLVFACSSARKETADGPADEYFRFGSKQERENPYRGKVFAAYRNDGLFYSVYALAELQSIDTDREGRYPVVFLGGPQKGKKVYVKDIIFKSRFAEPHELKKGQVVLRDFNNPRDGNNKTDRWNKVVIYNTDKIEDGVVSIEIPHDKNDFMATRETIFISNVRIVTDPVLKDPRVWIP